MRYEYEADEEQANKNVPKLILPGEYEVTVEEIKDGTTQNGDPKVDMKLSVKGFNHQFVFDTITLFDKSNRGHGLTVHKLKCLGFAVDRSKINFDSDELVGKRCLAEIGIKEWQGKRYNRVINFKHLSDKKASNDSEEVPF